jgi:hypothetical protein
MKKRKGALSKSIETSGEVNRIMDELKKMGSGMISASWPGEKSHSLLSEYYKDSLIPSLKETRKLYYKGEEVSGTFIDETAKISPEDLDRMAKYWKTREKEISGGGWLIPTDVRDDFLRRAAKGEDISKYFEKPSDEGGYVVPDELAKELMSGKTLMGHPVHMTFDEMPISGSSPIWVDYLTDRVGINPEQPNVKNRLDQLMSNSEWVGYHYLAGNWDMWAGYLGDGYWVISVRVYNPEKYLRPWCLIFWRDHDDIFSWLHSEFPNGSVVLADDQDNAFYDEHFALIRKLAKWVQTFAQRFAEGEMSEEWTGHDE